METEPLLKNDNNFRTMKELEEYSDLFQAELDRAYLEDCGIQAAVFNRNINCIAWPNTGLLAVKLMVNDEDYLKAKEALANRPAIDANDIPEDK